MGVYTSYDTACETAPGLVEPCLDKGDMLFIVDSNYLLYSQNVSPFVAVGGHEDRFRIVLDKNIPFAGTTTTTSTTAATTSAASFGMKSDNANVGIVGLFKFTPATTGNYEFVSQCSGRGSCVDGACECFKGYTKDDCGTQSAYAV